MTKTWLYVLSNTTSKGKYYYIGMTYRLARRLNEHAAEQGAQCTSTYLYDTLEAVYKICDYECHDHACENELTLKLMRAQGGGWWKVRGGKWCKDRNDKPKELSSMPFPVVCKCGLPTDTRTSKKNGKTYRTCPRNYMNWIDETLDLPAYDIHATNSCGFFEWCDDFKGIRYNKKGL